MTKTLGSGTDFPTNADAVTSAWLTDLLRAAGELEPDVAVSAVSWSSLGQVGFMGDVARLHVSYSDDRPRASSFILKSAAPDARMREMVRGFRNYEREVGFFQQIAPSLGDAVPHCVSAAIDLPTNHFMLLLEDLSVNYRDGDQLAGCTLQEARQCLDVQLDLHTRFWAADNNPELAWIPNVGGDWYVATAVQAFAVGWAGIVKRFPALVPDQLRTLGEDFAEHLPWLAAQLSRCPQSLVHSDFRLDNIMFALEPGVRPVKVLDWQGILVSAAVHDVAFLLSQNLTEEMRSTYERDLIDYYHAGLLARGVLDYSASQLWEDYRLAVLLEWWYAVVIGGSLQIASVRSRDLFAAMVRRSGRAIVELNALELLPSQR